MHLCMDKDELRAFVDQRDWKTRVVQTVDDFADVQRAYRDFARDEAELSLCFSNWAAGVAEDPEVLERLVTLPMGKRQPNLVFAAARWHGSGTGPYDDLRTTLLSQWDDVRPTVLARSTQTNEVGRCAALLPLFADLPQPLALLEIGASAGLCLLPDRYSYRYSDGTSLDPTHGVSPVVLACELSGPVPVPPRLPEVAWRRGVDLNPLDPANADSAKWLEMLVWPEHEERRTRLSAAMGIARADPPIIVAGDLFECVADVAATAPSDATLVVFHSAVFAYVPRPRREEWVRLAADLPGYWISNEGPGVLPTLSATAACSRPKGPLFALALDGQCLGWSHGHGQSLHWC